MVSPLAAHLNFESLYFAPSFETPMDMMAGDADYLGSDSCLSHNMDFAMQKYLLLHNQHEELQQHLYELCPSYTTSSTRRTSPSVSPTRSFGSSPSPRMSPARSRNHRRPSNSPTMGSRYGSSPTQLAPVLDESLVDEVSAGRQKLSDLNEGIKRALTEMLNCDSVRRDGAMRIWVQSRLMDTERELRSGRRRRSNGSVD
ncbi:hypothetical protein F4780DRAFT_782282 [Xylariomycetidae sp. FL0641]|nr:hypothetical protein F4780DRAFT_782282 [Xylariomycetidae sp. FL0641]